MKSKTPDRPPRGSVLPVESKRPAKLAKAGIASATMQKTRKGPTLGAMHVDIDALGVNVASGAALEGFIRSLRAGSTLEAFVQTIQRDSVNATKLSGNRKTSAEKRVHARIEAVSRARRLAREAMQRDGRRSLDAVIEREPVVDFSAEAARLGVPLGPTADPERAEATLRRVAEDASDLFGSAEFAISYLSSRDIDGFGHTGLTLIAERGLPALLMKLDELRFGFAG